MIKVPLFFSALLMLFDATLAIIPFILLGMLLIENNKLRN